MRLRSARAITQEMTLSLFGRVLHPELFDTCAVRELRHNGCRVVMRICGSGHVVQVSLDRESASEVSGADHLELPRRGRCLSIPLSGGRDISAEPTPGIHFQASTHVEWLDPVVFERLTQEFRADLRLATLSQVFSSRNRLRPEPLSLLHADLAPGSLVVHAFHTFPDELAVARTQSLYQF